MHILLINHYAGSPEYGMEFRAYYMAHEWVKMGHDVTIAASSFSHLRMKEPSVKKDYTLENVDGIRYLWMKGNRYEGSLMRIANIFSFVVKMEYYARKIAKDFTPDVVINSSTYPLDIYPTRKIAKLAQAKLIYEIHDLWPLSPMVIGGYSEKHPFIRVMQRAEDECYRSCDKVVSLLWNAVEHIRDRHFNTVKFACIPNGYVKEEWSQTENLALPESHSRLFQTLHKQDKIIVGYSGGHTPSTALETLLHAAEILRDCQNIAFVLVGKGVSKNELVNWADSRKLENVFFLDSVKKRLIPQLISHFDIAYMGGVHSILHKYGTSFNKMTDYMLSSKPIVFSADEPGSLIEKVGCGIRVEAENAEQVAQTIQMMAQKKKSELESMGLSGRKYAIANLEYGILAHKFIEEIENI